MITSSYDCSSICVMYTIIVRFCLNYWEIRTKVARRLHGHRAISVESSHSLPKISTDSFFATGAFAARSKRGLLCGNRAMLVRYVHGFVIKKMCITFLYELEEALEPVNPYDNHSSVAIFALRFYGNRDTASLRAP